MDYEHESREAWESERQTAQMDTEDITVLSVKPLREPCVITIPNKLRTLQDQVGGMIETVYPFEDPVAILLNDEGKLNGSIPNRGLYDKSGNLYDVIAGTFLIVGLSEEDFCSLSEELSAKYMEKYKIPERMALINGRIRMLPVTDSRKPRAKTSQNQTFGKKSRTDEAH
ncbi:MAG: DUF3846 domain-containing protein [Schaedlerella sp.]|uniref:DUF3846 domain-containing protein n=1 Tax=Schaedlerella sp. TaxID=2676057 RepID=UPI00272B879D|nr:DUF3846 domain-containing protein [uncultured Schaedlerella sp.]